MIKTLINLNQNRARTKFKLPRLKKFKDTFLENVDSTIKLNEKQDLRQEIKEMLKDLQMDYEENIQGDNFERSR